MATYRYSAIARRGHNFAIFLLAFLLTLIFLPACMPAPNLQALDTPILPSVTPTLTPTIVWFPPTATATLPPTPIITPTLDIRPQIGDLFLEDNFSNEESWNLAESGQSSVALGNNEISLAIHQPKIYLYTLRKEGVFDNFYLEITASPNICMGEDEYGILFRVTPAFDFYRLALTCGGQIRLDRVFQGKASSPVPKTYSGAVPPGAPSSSLIAIWASGKEMSFYVNQQFQFTFLDTSIQSGNIGLFARSAGTNDLSVSFSNLLIYKVK